MKDELAEKLLARIMDWDAATLSQLGRALQALARYKYDEYEGYRPGEQFLESLAGWLWQFDTGDRQRLVDFVLQELVFISRAELDHAIESAYPDIVRPLLLSHAASELGVPRHCVRQIAESAAFKDLHRKTLVLGLADGARLDRLRRSSEFSHEQFAMGPLPGHGNIRRLHGKLEHAAAELGLSKPARFRLILLADDFSGSGYTLIRRDDSGGWDGKLPSLAEQLNELRGEIFSDDVRVVVLLYVASQRALDNLRTHLTEAGLDWQVRPSQVVPISDVPHDEALVRLCTAFFDPVLNDEHMQKGEGEPALGFDEVALPLILPHNTPNNSISILWADSRDVPDSRRMHALFPRRRRHVGDRP